MNTSTKTALPDLLNTWGKTMNAYDHNFPAPAKKLDATGDAIARALAKLVKSPAELQNDKRLFRFRAKRDAKAVMRSVRNEYDLLNRLSLSWLYAFQIEAPASIDEAIRRLERAYFDQKSLTGTPHANGHAYMAIRSRLTMARYFRRFPMQIGAF